MRTGLHYIYALCHPTTNEVLYIGRSCIPRERLKRHMKQPNRKMKAYLAEQPSGFEFELQIFHSTPNKRLAEYLEPWYIEAFDTPPLNSQANKALLRFWSLPAHTRKAYTDMTKLAPHNL